MIQQSDFIIIILMDKSTSMNVFEMKAIKRQFGYKISAADVFNEFIYIGDEKGNIYSYPLRKDDVDVIPKNINETTKNISKSKIDKIICYGAISTILILTDEKLMTIDTGLKKNPDNLAAKIHDFAINQSFLKEGPQSVVAISRKKEGFLFLYNSNTKKLQQTTSKFNVSDIPTCLGYTANYIILSYKKQYQVLNTNNGFSSKKGPLSSKNPFFKVTNSNEVLFFSEDIGIFMEPEFMPKQKDNIFVPKPVLSITLGGSYCFILFQNLLHVYTAFDSKRFVLVQELPLINIKGITSERPFAYGRQELYYLYEIPYETQIKILLEKCRVEDAISLLIQNVGAQNEQKIEQLKLNAIWPLIKKMQFQKCKDIIQSINFDIREIVLLFPQLIGLQIESLKARADKTMSTMIVQFINEKASKSKDEELDLKKKSKIFLKEILEAKRQFYTQKSNMNKIKIQFNSSKNSLIKPKLQPATPQEILEIIDFTLIKWFLDMKMFKNLEEYFLSNPQIYCKRLYSQFDTIIRNNQKIFEFPNLIPRFFAAFDKIEEAFQAWKKVSQSQKQASVKTACEQAVKLLTQFQDRGQIYKKLHWILKKRPQIGMSFFNMVPINFIQPDEIIRNFQNDKADNYLQLYLEIIVIQKNTEVEAYHTKLLLLYLQNMFKMHPKQNKEQGKGQDFNEKLAKMRKFLKSPTSKYASQPILKKIQKCEWLMEDQIYLYSRQKRHEQALKKYINKNMSKEAEKYCQANKEQTLTIYFKMLITMYKSFQVSKNSSALLLRKDIILFLKRYSSNPQLDPIVVLELIPEDWMLNDTEGVGGIYQFLQSANIHTLHEKRTIHTAKHLSEMDLLNVQYNLIQAKRAYLRFTYTKKCVICQLPIADKYFVVYPNANVCHQACVKKEKNTICPITKQDFEKTFKY